MMKGRREELEGGTKRREERFEGVDGGSRHVVPDREHQRAVGRELRAGE
jgi:hypothetical protein